MKLLAKKIREKSPDLHGQDGKGGMRLCMRSGLHRIPTGVFSRMNLMAIRRFSDWLMGMSVNLNILV